MSPALRLVRGAARVVQKPYLARITDPVGARRRLELAAWAFARGRRPTRLVRRRIAGVPCLVGPGAPALLVLHGGAYVLGSAATHAAMGAGLARAARLAPVLVDYPLAPEHPFPAAVDAASAVYRRLALDGPVAVAGDSAGGGLALAVALRAAAIGCRPPAAMALFSPWTDLSVSGPSVTENATREPMLPAARLPEIAAAYLGGADPRSPLASPLFGAWRAPPPVFVSVGSDEILRDDSVRLAEALRAAGGQVVLHDLGPSLHALPVLGGWVPEADALLEAAGQALRGWMALPPSAPS